MKWITDPLYQYYPIFNSSVLYPAQTTYAVILNLMEKYFLQAWIFSD